MAITYQINLDDLELGQLLDGLEMRAESWERTAGLLRNASMPENEYFVVEECSKPEEADSIAKSYRRIISKISDQMQAQQS